MSFYQEIAKYYDDIFRLNEKQLYLLKQIVNNRNDRVLDVACATGTYVFELRKLGIDAYGIDLDETMINFAQEKLQSNKYCLVRNMLDLQTVFSDHFSFIYSIGNSLVHLNNEHEIFDFLTQAYNLLEKDGTLLIQIINFDRIINEQITSLPTITNKTKALTFIRNYELTNNYIFFKTELTVHDRTFRNSVALLPITAESLTKLLKTAGFTVLNLYGDFTLNPFNPKESFHLIVIAKK